MFAKKTTKKDHYLFSFFLEKLLDSPAEEPFQVLVKEDIVELNKYIFFLYICLIVRFIIQDLIIPSILLI